MTLPALPRLALALLTGTLLTTTGTAQKPPKRDRNLISREELVQAAEKFTDLYQAIRSLRPHFLTVSNRGVRTSGIGEGTPSSTAMPGTTRSAGTGGSNAMSATPVVYLDGRKIGDAEFLRSLLTKDVGEVRYLSPNDAGMEYGLGHEGGAIVVKLYTAAPNPPE